MPTEVERYTEQGNTRHYLPNGWKCNFINCDRPAFDTEVEALACERWHIALTIQTLPRDSADRAAMLALAKRLDASRPDVVLLVRRQNCERMLALLTPLVEQLKGRGLILRRADRLALDRGLACITKGAQVETCGEVEPGDPPRYYELLDRMLRRELREAAEIVDAAGGRAS